MINQRIIINNGDGSIGIVIPSPEFVAVEGNTMAVLQAKIVPEGLASRITNVSNIPSNRDFRNAWTDDTPGVKVDVDMPKARDIHMDKIRVARDKKLIDFGIEQIIAAEQDDTVKLDLIKIEKQVLRDLPQTFDLTIATTPEELKALWPTELQ